MNKINYTQVGDYELSNLTVPTKRYHIGKYGMLHRTFIKQNHPVFYTTMLMQGTLLEYLEQLDHKAQNRVYEIIAQKAKEQGITEKLKAQNQMLWVGLMNNIKSQAEEMVYKEIVYNIMPNSILQYHITCWIFLKIGIFCYIIPVVRVI